MNVNIDQMIRVAIYLRLSKDDGDFSLSENGKTESNSIHNQRELLMSFLQGHPEMELVGEYKDDGYTGTNFDRPDFQKMIQDIQKGLINCVIVKDLSRFGRDYIECGRYIEKLFPQLGVRFIAVNDHFDTASGNQSDSIVVPFKNLINDSYSRDISIKVRSNLAVKRNKGEFIGNFTVYGYVKDPENKNHLLIDEYAASIVRNIFRWKLEGFSPVSIADKLNKAGILSPMEYKKAKGSRYETSFKKSALAEWSHVAVRRILKNEIYTGVMLQGKRTTPNYKTKTEIKKAESEWARKEGTHEPIVSKAEFDLVQRLLREDTRAGTPSAPVHPLCGKLLCGKCGEPVVRKSTTSGGRIYAYYLCKSYGSKKTGCASRRFGEDKLHGLVLAVIKQEIDVLLDMEKALKSYKDASWEESEMKKIDTNIAMQEEIIRKNNDLRMGVYEDFQAGILSREEYAEYRADFSVRIDTAREAIRQLLAEKSEIQDSLGNQKNWLEQFHEYVGIKELDRRYVVALIDRIYLFDDGSIEIVFRHKNQKERILNFIREQEAARKRKPLVLVPTVEVV